MLTTAIGQVREQFAVLGEYLKSLAVMGPLTIQCSDNRSLVIAPSMISKPDATAVVAARPRQNHQICVNRGVIINCN